jgi:hypothetical protein
MTTSVACAGCHRRYQVDDRFAGKTIKCAVCGQPMAIPVVETSPAPPQAFHGEYALGDDHEKEPSILRAAPERRKGDRADGGGREKARKQPKRSKRRTAVGELTKGLLPLPIISVCLAAVVVVLALVAEFVPSTRWAVGVALTVPGLLLCLYGYASGVYIAFTEDDFHGWLCLLFPFYAAYYLVSRWDDMSSRLIMVVVGLVLLGIGGRLLEAEFTKAAAAAAARAEAGR